MTTISVYNEDIPTVTAEFNRFNEDFVKILEYFNTLEGEDNFTVT